MVGPGWGPRTRLRPRGLGNGRTRAALGPGEGGEAVGGCQRSGEEEGEVVRAEGAPGVRTLDRCHPRGKVGQKQEV